MGSWIGGMHTPKMSTNNMKILKEADFLIFIKHPSNEKVLVLPLMPLSTHTWCHNGEFCEVIYT